MKKGSRAFFVLTLLAVAVCSSSSQELLTADALQKLKNITQGAKAANLDAAVVKALAIGSGGDVSVKQFKAETALGLYVFTIPVKPATEDVIFSFRDPAGVTVNYLSDTSLTLRKVVVADADGVRAVPNAGAESGFQDSLKAWGIIARRVKVP
jgi:hypothetical protein